MKKLDLGQTITIVANLGVIAGIALLALELRQNNLLLRAEAISSVFETRSARQELVVNNDSLITTMAKNDRGEILTDEDMIRLVNERNRSLIGWQRDYFLFQEGILTEKNIREANFAIMRLAFSDDDSTYSGRDHWEAYKMLSASPAFREFVERCIISDCETIPR